MSKFHPIHVWYDSEEEAVNAIRRNQNKVLEVVQSYYEKDLSHTGDFITFDLRLVYVGVALEPGESHAQSRWIVRYEHAYVAPEDDFQNSDEAIQRIFDPYYT